MPFESVQKALEDGQFACRIFIDLGSHDILTEKLNHYAVVLKQKDIKLHFKEIPFFLPKSMKTCFSKKIWFCFIIFKYFLDDTKKIA